MLITLDVETNETTEARNEGGSNAEQSAINGWDRADAEPRRRHHCLAVAFATWRQWRSFGGTGCNCFVNVQSLTSRAHYLGYRGIVPSPFFGRPTSVAKARTVDVGISLQF